MQKPNVVVFFTDQQRWDTLGVQGNPMGLTPNLDRFSARNTLYENAFTCQPVCGPARSCIQTGKYATQTGVYKNGLALKSDENTLATVFGNADYKTGYIGKWHLAGVELGHLDWQQEPVPPDRRGGYQFWLGADATEFISDAYNAVLFDGQGNKQHLPGYRVDAITDAGIRYIQQHKDDQFFLVMSHLEPHHQNHTDNFPAPDGYEASYTDPWMPPDLRALGGTAAQHLPGYYGMIKRIDEAFGRILDALRSLNLEQNTIVVFVSDHGNHFKTRNDEYKRSCHDSSIRIPLAIGGPGFEGGGRVRQLVSLVDLAPTLMDACGLDVPSGVQGVSTLPLLSLPKSTWVDEIFVQISESQIGRALRTERWKYAVSALNVAGDSAPAAPVYTETHLYDLWNDPYELANLAGMGRYRPVADVLKQRLLDRISREEGAHPEIENAPVSPDVEQRTVFPEDIPEAVAGEQTGTRIYPHRAGTL